MKNLIVESICPACGNRLKIVRLQCEQCHTAVEGKFDTPPLSRLNPEQQQFVEIFINARGSIKEVEKKFGVSYPTVCKKLDEISKALGLEQVDMKKRETEILHAIEKGELSAEDGVDLLKQL